MTLSLYRIEGFDYIDSATISRIFSAASGTTVVSPGSDGVTGKHLRVAGSASDAVLSILPTIPNGDRIILGFAFMLEALAVTFFRIYNLGGAEFHLSVTGGVLECTRDGAALTGATGTTSILIDTWYYVELEVIISNTVGEVHCYLNGVEEFSTASTLDTDDTSTGGTTGTNFIGGSGKVNHFDDFYFGRAPSGDTAKANFLSLVDGPPKIVALVPSGAGTYAEWTPSASTNVSNVDEVVPDDDATYNATTIIDERDTFAMGNLPSSGTVLAVESVHHARKTDAGNRSLEELYRIGGADYATADEVPLSTSYAYQRQLRAVSPATAAAWTEAEVNGLELGYKLAV